MTEINQEERAYLAFKQNPPLRLQYKTPCGSWWDLTTAPRGAGLTFRVHPEDEKKLDAIIWEDLYSGDNFAWLNQDGDILGTIKRGSFDKTLGYKLIATRELPAEKPCFDYGRIDAEKAEGESGEAHFITNKEAKLVADLKEFVAVAVATLQKSTTKLETEEGRAFLSCAEALLERINPKPVRCSSQLPIDTLCEVDTGDGIKHKRFTVGNGFSTNLSCFDYPTTIRKNFKVIEQPHPTFWQGGECPYPEWVKARVWYRNGSYGDDQIRSPKSGWMHDDRNSQADIIAYQIMGEKE